MTENSQTAGIDDHTMNSTLNDFLDHHPVPSGSSSSSSSSSSRLIVNRDNDDQRLSWPSSEDPQGTTDDGGLPHHHRLHSPDNDVTTMDSVSINAETSSNRVTTRRRGRGSKKNSRQHERTQAKDTAGEDNSRHRGTLEHSEVLLLDAPHFLANVPSRQVTHSQSSHDSGYHSSVAHSPPSSAAPSSSSSSSSRYHPYASHSRTGSSSTRARSSSPAGSVMSITTSHSNGTSHLSQGLLSPIIQKHRKQRKQKLTDEQRREICEFAEKNPTMRQEDIAIQWSIERSTVSKILKDKEKWLSNETPIFLQPQISKHRPTKFPKIESEMTDWLLECDDKKLQITDAMIRDKGKQIALKWNIGEDKFKASAGWVENFKHRKGIRRGVWMHREDFFPSGRILSEEPPEDVNAATYDQEAFYDRTYGPYDPTTGLIPHHARRQPESDSTELDPASTQPYALLGATGAITANEDVNLEPDQIEVDNADQVPNHDGVVAPLGDEYDLSQTQVGLATFSTEEAPSAQFDGGSVPSQPESTSGYFAGDGIWTEAPFDPNDGPEEVSAQDAEKGLDVVIKFFKQQGPDFLEPDESDALYSFKTFLFKKAHGLPTPKRPKLKPSISQA